MHVQIYLPRAICSIVPAWLGMFGLLVDKFCCAPEAAALIAAGFRLLLAALTRPGRGIGPEFVIAQFPRIADGVWAGGAGYRLRFGEQAALEGLIRRGSGQPGHGPGGAALIVPSLAVAFRV